jgi:hypothetical protein
LPRVERPVGSDPVDGQDSAVEQDERSPRCFADGLFERRCQGGQEVDGFGDVPVRGRRADAEPGCELGVGMPVAEVGKGEQRLSVGAQPAPPAADRTTTFAQTGGKEAKVRTGQVQAGRVDKHVKPLAVREILVVTPSTRGFTRLSHQLPDWKDRLEKAHFPSPRW